MDINEDNHPFKIGANDDFELVHNGTNTVITSKTGNFIIDNTNTTGLTVVSLGSDTTTTKFDVQNDSGDSVFTVDALGAVSNPSGYKRTVINSATYTVLQTDEIVAVTYTTTGSVTITLPQISSLTTPNKYSRFVIVDEGGNAGTNNITVNRSGTDTIIGNTSVVINGDYNSYTVYSNGSNLWQVY